MFWFVLSNQPTLLIAAANAPGLLLPLGVLPEPCPGTLELLVVVVVVPIVPILRLIVLLIFPWRSLLNVMTPVCEPAWIDAVPAILPF